ncbi:response regulator [Paenibacillus hamazuiensis]|uniref:response regulator n=1 Tax=Paenibacillus hamazuiensis TaxID=2936508 RepID=UPI00200F8F05|nr:response regulator [Paenibacillus hamazuiensis]
MKILLVDDDAYVLNGLRQMIDWGRLGIEEVMTAGDGEEAWELYVRRKPDLLVTDVYMPRMNSLELIRKIRKHDVKLPVVILSGYGEFHDAKEAIHLQVAQYVLKPAVFMEIENVLRQVICEKNAADQKEQYFRGLQSQLEQSIPVLREQFLFDLLTARVRETDIAAKKLEFLRMEERVFHGGLVMSLLLHREGSRKTEAEKDWQLYKFAAYNIAQEIVSVEGGGCLLRYMEDRLPVLLYGSEEETRQRAKRIAGKLLDGIGNYLELPANVGIGRWYGSYAAYPASHKESRDVLTAADYEGYQKTFDAQEAGTLARSSRTVLPLEEIRRLAEALMQPDRGGVEKIWGQIERMLLNEKALSFKYVKTLCVSAIHSVALHTMHEDSAVIEDMPLPEFLQSIESARRPEELMERIRDVWAKWLSALEMKYNEGRQHAYVQHVKKAVAEHYCEGISFAKIADELHVTRNHLSGLFKRETGESFSDYLTRFRIEKAKELMKTQRYMIYEISEMVGYSDPAYFSRMFKAVTGISPTDYAMGRK